MDTTDFFKSLITKKNENTEKLKDLDPDQKEDMIKSLSSQKYFMMPLEIKQLKNALQKERACEEEIDNTLFQDGSKIPGLNPTIDITKQFDSKINESKRYKNIALHIKIS